MALLVSDKERDDMKKWTAFVEKYNEASLGGESPLEVKEVKEENGNTILVLRPKASATL